MKKLFFSSRFVLPAFLVVGVLLVGAHTVFAAVDPVTQPATNIDTTSVTLNGTNGDTMADAGTEAFWYGPTPAGAPFVVGSVPPGWTDGIFADTDDENPNGNFSYNLTGLTPNTTYYYVSWVSVGGTWYPGSEVSFTTAEEVSGPVFIDTNTNGTYDEGEADFDNIEDAVSAAVAGDTIVVTAGPHVLSSTINLDKALTLEGVGSPIVQVSGSSTLFHVSAEGVAIRGLKIEKTDKATQTLIHIASSNTHIEDNEISGNYVFGEGDVARAMVLQGGLSGIEITGNTIHDLRQPAYISGVTTGTVSNNYVYKTRGWVIEQGDLTFTDNTWGEGADANVFDIAILGTVGAEYYTNIPAMSQANHDASIEDQRGVSATLSIVYVDGSVGVSGTGTQSSPKKTLAEGVARVAVGGTVVLVTDVTLTEQVTINKSLTLEGNGNTVSASFPKTDNSNNSAIGIIGTTNVTIQNLIVDGTGGQAWPAQLHGFNIYESSSVSLDAVTASNFMGAGIAVNASTVDVNDITTSGNAWGGINIDKGTITNPTLLTVNGESTHTEVGADIWRDDNANIYVNLVDTEAQYSSASQMINATMGTVWTLLPKFTLTYVAGDNGSITGDDSQSVVSGHSGTAVTAVADNGYHFSSWSDGITTETRTDTNVTADKEVTANFDRNSSGGSGGRRRSPATPATPAVPGQNPATPATPGEVLGAETGPTPGFVFTKFLKMGPPYNVAVNGAEVMELQKFLNAKGFGPLVVDGKFGPMTKAAVIKFQLANGLVGDGIVGPLTRAALNK